MVSCSPEKAMYDSLQEKIRSLSSQMVVVEGAILEREKEEVSGLCKEIKQIVEKTSEYEVYKTTNKQGESISLKEIPEDVVPSVRKLSSVMIQDAHERKEYMKLKRKKEWIEDKCFCPGGSNKGKRAALDASKAIRKLGVAKSTLVAFTISDLKMLGAFSEKGLEGLCMTSKDKLKKEQKIHFLTSLPKNLGGPSLFSRTKGIGTAMVGAAADQGRSSGFQCVTLISHGQEARLFYRQMGFTQCDGEPIKKNWKFKGYFPLCLKL